jgi:hypothetical protein
MTEQIPTNVELDRAYRLGRIAGRADRDDCPFNANGTGYERVMARRWVQGRLDTQPA